MTRNGKIARLPAAIREELNQRLLDGGESGAFLASAKVMTARRTRNLTLPSAMRGSPVKVNTSEFK
jgi:hypothetical protein